MKKVSVNTVKSFLKEHKRDEKISVPFSVGESELVVEIKVLLSEAEKSMFISRILTGCFDGNDNFRPEYVTPMLRATIIQMCTNLPVLTLKNEQGEDGESLMDIGAMEALYEALDLDQLEDPAYQQMLSGIVQLSLSAIEWRKARILAKDSAPDIRAFTAFEAASNAVRQTVEKLGDFDYERLIEYAGRLSQATEELEEGNIVQGLFELHKNETH